jgi:hypothetical protein
MVNKQKTIQRAVAKYRTVLPVRGKNSLDECFFCLRGIFFFQFRTQDKNVHTWKADVTREVITAKNKNVFSSFITIMKKPLYIRSLIIKNRKPPKKLICR